MIKFIKHLMFLLLFFTSTVFSADKPTWTIDLNKLNLPQHSKPVRLGKEANPDPNFKVQFTPDNKILISFLEITQQTEIATKITPEKSDSIFVVLVLSRENGDLIKRVEWPVIGESVPAQQTRYGSRIYPLPSGGYVGIINRHLRVFDSALYVIYERILERHEDTRYNLITPLCGKYFSVEFWGENRTTEIIDSKTFKTVEQLSTPNFLIIDILGDQLLSASYSKDIIEHRFFEKTIGASQWKDLGLAMGSLARAKYIYNGAIVFTDIIGQMPYTEGLWFMVEEGKKSEKVFRGLQFKPSLNTSIVAAGASHLSDFRRTFDMDSKDWIEAYDLNTRQVLLATKRYSASDIVDYAISPNGDSVVLMTKKKIELYNVNSKKAKKK